MVRERTLLAHIIGAAHCNLDCTRILVTLQAEQGAFGVAEADLAVPLDEAEPVLSARGEDGQPAFSRKGGHK
jgi:hypothetical protein